MFRMSVISFTILWSRTQKLWEPVTHRGCPLSCGCAKRVQGGEAGLWRVAIVEPHVDIFGHCVLSSHCCHNAHRVKRVLAHCDKWAITHFLFTGLVRRPALNTSFMGAELNARAGVRVKTRSAMQPSWLNCFYNRKKLLSQLSLLMLWLDNFIRFVW